MTTVIDAATKVVQSTGEFIWTSIISPTLPQKKTVVRASLFAVIALLPVILLLLVTKPLAGAGGLALAGWLAYATGLREEVRKQLKWMKKMSYRGPIFWALARAKKLSVRASRRFYGDKMDVMPKAPLVAGMSTRGAERATFKWVPASKSSFSVERFEIEIRATAPKLPDDEEPVESMPWVSLGADFEVDGDAGTLPMHPLRPETAYEARVRAVNSKGASDWVGTSFRTKQKPVISEDEDWAGGVGPKYTWGNHRKLNTLQLLVPLPAGTRAKQLKVHVRPTALSVSMGATELMNGEFYANVSPDETDWELRDAADGARELVMVFVKADKKSDAPFWPQLLKSTPEVCVRASAREGERPCKCLMRESRCIEAVAHVVCVSVCLHSCLPPRLTGGHDEGEAQGEDDRGGDG